MMALPYNMYERVKLLIEAHNGRIWADMTMDEIQAAENMVSIELAQPNDETPAVLRGLEGVSGVQVGVNGRYDLNVNGKNATRLAIAETAVNQGWGLLSMTQAKVSLENIFLNKLREAEATGYVEGETAEEEE